MTTKLDLGLISEETAAQALGVSEKTLQNWRHSKRVALPFIKLGGTVRYRGSDLESFIRRQTRNSEPAAV